MTNPEARKIIRWLGSELGITDWTIHCEISNEVPARFAKGDAPGDSFGECNADESFKLAYIWINPKKHDDLTYGSIEERKR